MRTVRFTTLDSTGLFAVDPLTSSDNDEFLLRQA